MCWMLLWLALVSIQQQELWRQFSFEFSAPLPHNIKYRVGYNVQVLLCVYNIFDAALMFYVSRATHKPHPFIAARVYFLSDT